MTDQGKPVDNSVSKPGRIVELDGLRALAVAGVIASHAAKTAGHVPRWVQSVCFHGWWGVDLFFVISGFVITRLMIAEKTRTGTIDLRAFWSRRSWRILPASGMYLVFVGLVWSRISGEPISGRAIVAAATFTLPLTDWEWITAHFWSLAVEMQFYAIWPLVFRRAARAEHWGQNVILAMPLVRAAAFTVLGDTAVDNSILGTADRLAAGCLLATVPMHKYRGGWVWSIGLVLLGLGGMLSMKAYGETWPVAEFVFGGSYRTLIFAGVVATALVAHASGKATILRARPLVWVGSISYSLYLMQQPFFNVADSANWACLWPRNVMCAIVAGVLLHYLVERPTMRTRPASFPENWSRPMAMKGGEH